MFIKECITVNRKTKVKYKTHKLVESYRNIEGLSRHRVIMNLGTLELPRIRWRELASILESRISGQQSFLEEEADIASLADDIMKHNAFVKTKAREKSTIDASANMQQVDLNSTKTALHRTLGAELVADAFWKRLNFDNILKKCNFNDKQISLAKAIILGRLINPESEYATWQWFQSQTALIEMTEVNLTGIGKNGFYEIGDLLLANKEKIEKSLLAAEKSMFSIENNIFLYDLTNTYFEGNCKNNKKAKRGHSKEKRTDCPLVTLALMVNSEGFPIYSNIYEGNKGEPLTLTDIVTQLEKDIATYNLQKKPVLIMDRGIATKKNIDLIVEKGYRYTVICRRESEKDFKNEFEIIKHFMNNKAQSDTKANSEADINKNDKFNVTLNIKEQDIPGEWEKISDKQDVYVKKIISENKCCVLSVSGGRTVKEQSMDSQKEERFIEEMEKLKKSFEKGNIIMPIKIAERIGRIKAKYGSASKFYEIELKVSDDNKKVEKILWVKKPQRNERNTITGCYVIETTQKDLSAVEIWKQYTQLTRVESAFKDLKSELGLRPIFHQTESRTESHLFIGVLAYHLLNSIEYSMRIAGDTREWKSIKKVLSTHERCTSILNGSDKKVFHIRNSSLPEPVHNEIYRMLNIKDTLKSKNSCVLQRL